MSERGAQSPRKIVTTTKPLKKEKTTEIYTRADITEINMNREVARTGSKKKLFWKKRFWKT